LTPNLYFRFVQSTKLFVEIKLGEDVHHQHMWNIAIWEHARGVCIQLRVLDMRLLCNCCCVALFYRVGALFLNLLRENLPVCFMGQQSQKHKPGN